jgi:hypothetical protein
MADCMERCPASVEGITGRKEDRRRIDANECMFDAINEMLVERRRAEKRTQP